MKALFEKLKVLVESAKAPLFTSFTEDFELDKDFILNDSQVGDVLYFAIKVCGTYLCLADNKNEFMAELLSDRHSPERRHFIIRVNSETDFEITEYHTFESLRKAVSQINPRAGRKPKRQFGSEILFGLDEKLRGTILMSDFSMQKGAVLYLTLNNNSASYVTNTGVARTIGLPFSLDRKTGVYKITINTQYGHGECEQIKAGVFSRAQKLYLRKKAA